MKQVIYIDILLCINFVFSFFALLSVIKILKINYRPIRLFLGSIVGALSSLVVIMPEMNFIFSSVIKLLTAFIVIFAAFYPIKVKTFIKSTACFFMVGFIFCGVMIALWLLFKPKGVVIRNGGVYFQISPIVLITSTLAAYVILRVLSRLTGREKNKNSICKLELFFNDKHTILYGIVDSGNKLREPFSNLPVIVVSEKSVDFNKSDNLKFRIIPFNSIGGEGFLEGFKADKLYLVTDKQKQPIDAYIAIAKSDRFSGEFNAIVPNIFFEWLKEELIYNG